MKLKHNYKLVGVVLLIFLLILSTILIKISCFNTEISGFNTETIEDNKYYSYPLYKIINPISSYFICDHYISTEIQLYPVEEIKVGSSAPNNSTTRHPIDTLELWRKASGLYPNIPNSDYWSNEITRKLIKGNNLLKNKNYDDIQNYDIIQCQVNHFEQFVNTILPKINKKIILITSQCGMPQIEKNKMTDELLQNDKIILWISQNPIYKNHQKYMAFPYGIHTRDITEYYNFIKNNIKMKKNINVSNLYASAWGWLESNHIRKKYDILGKDSGPKLDYHKYLEIISDSKFLISTAGDRNDCYRHYEAIGLGTIPISNINTNYYDIFEDSMYITDDENVFKIAKNKKFDKKYWKPNKNIIYLEYWKKKLNDRIQKIKNKNKIKII